VPSFFAIILAGFLYDLVGRRFTLMGLLLISGISIVFLPFVAPSHPLYILIGVIEGLGLNMIVTVPLTIDYAVKDSIGKAQALSMIGISLGAIFGIGILVPIMGNFSFEI